MINTYLQLYSWILSFFIGIIYGFILDLFIKYTVINNVIIKVFKDVAFVFVMSILLIYIYYKFNGGYIHYGYLLFFILGYVFNNIVKNRVNINRSR